MDNLDDWKKQQEEYFLHASFKNEGFCLDSNQVERLVQLVKHELVCLDALMNSSSLSDSAMLHLTDECALYDSILDVLLKRG